MKKMELLTIVNKLIDFFELNDIGELIEKLKVIEFSNDKNKIYDEYLDIVGDLEIDWIQKIFQYYKSNRDDLKQDYTPKSMSKCLAKILYHKGAKKVLDVCSGSGSLVVELSKLDNNMVFDCLELDDNVIPLLLFNLSIHNIQARVFKYDVIEQEMYECYILTKGEKYSDIRKEEVNHQFIGLYDIITSNPPFNLKIKLDYKSKTGLSVKNSSNAFFTLYCIDHLKENGKCGLILPTGFITSQKKDDLYLREYLIQNNLLEVSISNPGNFFESTPVNTSFIIISKNTKEEFLLLNCYDLCSEWIREQRGQFGGAAHTNRVYKKKFNCYSDEDIDKILDIIDKNIEVKDCSKLVKKEEFKERNYSYSAGQYFEVTIEKIKITQEEYDDMINKFFKNNEIFCNTMLQAQNIFQNFLKA